MEMNFGKKFKGKEVAWVLFREPGYVEWMMREGIKCDEMNFINKLIDTFDSKPYINVSCRGECKGKNEVRYLALYNGQIGSSYWFCNECDPYKLHSLKNLVKIERLSDAVLHNERRILVMKLAKAKGAPERMGKKSLAEYFGY